MTVCPKCDGRGTVGYFHIDHFVDIECDRCNGSGEVSEVEMTNEEWFCKLDTEDKAREISDMTAQGYWSEELVEKWLKEKHHAE